MKTVRNSSRIRAAKLVAEKANAELMTAIKEDMNLATDITDATGKIGTLATKIAAEADATKKAALQAKKTALEDEVGAARTRRGALATDLGKLKDKLSKTEAEAVGIESSIAEKQAEDDFEEAKMKAEEVDRRIEFQEAEEAKLQVEIELSNDAAERKRLKALLTRT